MDLILFVFVGMMCILLGIKVFNAETPNKVFSKYPLRLTDVKKYNQLCGVIIIGFGIVAEITIYFMITTEGLISTLCTVGIIVEAVAAVALYRVVEKKLVQKK